MYFCSKSNEREGLVMMLRKKKYVDYSFEDIILQDRGNGEHKYKLKVSFALSDKYTITEDIGEPKTNMLRFEKIMRLTKDSVAFVDVYLENYQTDNFGWYLSKENNKHIPSDEYIKDTFVIEDVSNVRGGFNDFVKYETRTPYVFYISEVTERTKLVISIFDPFYFVKDKDIQKLLDYKVEYTKLDDNGVEIVEVDEETQDEKPKTTFTKIGMKYRLGDEDIMDFDDDVLEIPEDDVYSPKEDDTFTLDDKEDFTLHDTKNDENKNNE